MPWSAWQSLCQLMYLLDIRWRLCDFGENARIICCHSNSCSKEPNGNILIAETDKQVYPCQRSALQGRVVKQRACTRRHRSAALGWLVPIVYNATRYIQLQLDVHWKFRVLWSSLTLRWNQTNSRNYYFNFSFSNVTWMSFPYIHSNMHTLLNKLERTSQFSG